MIDTEANTAEEAVPTDTSVESSATAPANDASDAATPASDPSKQDVQTVDSSSSGDVAQRVEVSSSTPTSTPISPALPSPEDFDWKNWDLDPQNLPEQLHPWMQRALAPYLNEYDRVRKELNRVTEELQTSKDLYQAITGGQEDPRFQELQAKTQEYETKIQELTEQVQTNDQRYESWIQSESQAWGQNFARRYGHILADENTKRAFDIFWDACGDPEIAIDIVQLPREGSLAAAKALRDGAPAHIALEFGRSKVVERQGAPPTPRAASQFTNGADGSGHTPATAESAPFEGLTSLAEYREAAAERALRRHS